MRAVMADGMIYVLLVLIAAFFLFLLCAIPTSSKAMQIAADFHS